MSLAILLIHSEPTALNLAGFAIESQVISQVHYARDAKTALQILHQTNIHIQVVLMDGTIQVDTLMNTLKSKALPIILIEPHNPNFPLNELGSQILSRVDLKEVPERLVECIKEHFHPKEAFEASKYCHIRAEILARVGPLSGDVFIKLSDNKFVKLYRAGTLLGQEEYERIILSQKVRNLFVNLNDAKDFIQKLKSELEFLIEAPTTNETSLLEQSGIVQDTVQELYSKMGFTSEVQDLATQNIRLTLKAIGARPKLKDAISHSPLKGHNYISNHSVKLANIACALATVMEWPSALTFQKLVLASLLHDFTITNPEHAKYSLRSELEVDREKIGEEAYQQILNHPLKAADLIRKMKETPADVEFLVFQHHERPDGSGFPKALKSYQIVSLSAVFIVAHDILDAIMANPNNFDLGQFLIDHQNTYDGGAFKQVWRALSESHRHSATNKAA